MEGEIRGSFRARFGMKTKGNEKLMCFAPPTAFGVQENYSAAHQQPSRRKVKPVGTTEARGPHAKRVIPPDSGTLPKPGGRPRRPTKGLRRGQAPRGPARKSELTLGHAEAGLNTASPREGRNAAKWLDHRIHGPAPIVGRTRWIAKTREAQEP